MWYNGYKRLHVLKYQSVTSPSGMIANLFGPAEGKGQYCAIFAMSGLLQTLQRNSFGPNGIVLCNFGDPAYPINRDLLGP